MILCYLFRPTPSSAINVLVRFHQWLSALVHISGQMWNRDDKTQDTKAVIPDSSYAGVYSAVIDFCKVVTCKVEISGSVGVKC